MFQEAKAFVLASCIVFRNVLEHQFFPVDNQSYSVSFSVYVNWYWSFKLLVLECLLTETVSATDWLFPRIRLMVMMYSSSSTS